MLLHIRRFTIAQLDAWRSIFGSYSSSFPIRIPIRIHIRISATVSPNLGHLAVLLRFPLPPSRTTFIHSVCFALCLGFRLIFAHFSIRSQPFAIFLFPYPFLPLLLVCHCSRIRFCWPEPNERMTKTNSPQSELFYGYTICMLVCPRM